MTDADRARRAHAILTAALDTPRDQRDAMIAEACDGDAALHSRVRALVAAAERSDDFLESPALHGHIGGAVPVPDAIGNYIVVGVLGTGGMATVYEAIQENPHRHVALKVLHQSMTSTDAFLRFRVETETLARLRHPGIAQIYEAGTAQFGLPSPSPFFAMELVHDAQTITAYARSRALPLRERLSMFASVCDAVLYGHQNGVIHRDIKPGNILVGSDGIPKVIDFGIARTIGSSTGNPGITAEASRSGLLGTLNAMSPEQCLTPASVDARSDVYSLGVVLYELVTGRLPYDLTSVSIPEAVRIISEQPAPEAGSECVEAKGDLSAIIAKALQKDRECRYVGVAALAADVRRWLAFEPVDARSATTIELLKKFIRRNPALSGAIGAAALLLVVGMAVSAGFASAATRARDEAIRRERELEAITAYHESILRGIDVAAMGDRLRASLESSLADAENSSVAAGLDGTATDHARQQFQRLTTRVNFTSLAVQVLGESVLTRHAKELEAQFAEQPVLRARLLQQLADTMNALGLYAKAEPVLRQALTIRRSALGENHVDTLQSLHALGSLLSTLGQFDEAVSILKDAYERRSAVLGPEHQMTLRVGTGLGGAYRRQGNLEEAHRVWSRTLDAQRRVLGDDHEDTLRTLNNLGIVLATQGREVEAEACFRELLDRRRRLVGEDHPDYRGTLGNLGVLLQDQGKFAEARELLEQSLASDRRRYGDAHRFTLVSMAQLASLYQQTGDTAAAEALWRECAAGRSATLGPENPDTLRAMVMLGSTLDARGDRAGAIEIISRAIDTQRRTLGETHEDTLVAKGVLERIMQHAVPSAPGSDPDR